MKSVLAAAVALLAMPLMAGEAAAHGCHRDIQLGQAGWHRHAGPNCVRIATASPRYRYEGRRYRERCEIRCKYIGPFKTCDKVCR